MGITDLDSENPPAKPEIYKKRDLVSIYLWGHPSVVGEVTRVWWPKGEDVPRGYSVNIVEGRFYPGQTNQEFDLDPVSGKYCSKNAPAHIEGKIG